MQSNKNTARFAMKGFLLAFLISAGGLLVSNCAYQEVMDQRNAEERALQQQLHAEQARGAELTR